MTSVTSMTVVVTRHTARLHTIKREHKNAAKQSTKRMTRLELQLKYDDAARPRHGRQLTR
jgi:hypothetical protein